MPDDTRKKLGDFGEQAALAYLTRRGMVEIARKWRCRTGEIDLVLRENETLVFVEVRTQRGGAAGQAEASVGPAKQARLAALAFAYLEAQALPDSTPFRIDVVAVRIGRDGRIERINHIPDAIGEG